MVSRGSPLAAISPASSHHTSSHSGSSKRSSCDASSTVLPARRKRSRPSSVRAGTTVLLASHEDRLLETLCDEVWWLQAGEIAAKGDPRETMTRYRRFVAEQVRAWGETIAPRLAPSARRDG